MDSRYLRSLKAALVGDPEAELVMICNVEAEAQWALAHVGLPNPGLSASGDVVRRMAELGALLAGPGDTLLLPHPLDPAYREYLTGIGMPPPQVVVPTMPDCRTPAVAGSSVAEAALASPQVLERLAALGRRGARLLPMGTTALEEKLADACGLELAVP